jgi:hypothetical protein
MGDIFQMAGKSYRDALALVQQRGAVLGIALAILAAAGIASLLIEGLFASALARQLVSTLLNLAGIWLAAPYLVSLYRDLLGATPATPQELRGSDEARRFFGWSGVLAFITGFPGYVFAAFAPPGLTPETADSPEMITLVWGTMLLLLAAWIFTTRTITLLPDAALGTDAGLAQAFARTRRRFWFIVGAVSVPLLPITILGVILTSSTSGIVSVVFTVAMVLVLGTLALAVTANLYRWLLDNPK